MSKQVNYNENLVAGAAIRDDKGRRISKLFEASHPKMTVGYAKNLIMPNDPTEQEFNFRQAGGGVIEDGVAVIDKVKGNSVVWNQNFPYDASKWHGGAGSMTIDGSIITLSCGSSSYVERMTLDQCIIAGHKYYTRATIVETTGLSRISLSDTDSFIASDAAGTYSSIKVASLNSDLKIVNAGGVGQGATFKDVLFVDLTQMFGAGNEPATVEEFLSRKPKVVDEYAYNEGTIVNNKVEKVKTTGINLWDEQWELGAYNTSTGEKLASSNQIRSKNMFACLPHTSYYWRIPNKANGTYMGKCCFYDISRAFISSEPVGPSSFLTVTTPSNARFVAFDLRTEYGTTYNHDICINISDPAINDQYFPYEEHTLDLAWVKDIKDGEGVKLFEDGMKSAGTAFDEVGKNKAVKRFGVKVFDGTESFNDYLADYGSFAIMRDAFVGVGSTIGISNRYAVSRLWESDPDRTKYDKQIYIDSINNRVWIRDSAFADVDSLKQYLADLYAQGNPLVVYYELAEPIEVEYDEKSLTYPVVAGGTEEAIASEPSTTFRADIGYGIDAVKTILDLKARVEALEGK